MTKDQPAKSGTWKQSKTDESVRTTRPVDLGDGRRVAISTTDEPEKWINPDEGR